jgi:competence protein ComEC
MCDVGQGDAVVLATGDGRAVVVDAGGQPGPVDTCLRGLGISRVAMLLISHFHADHVGGIAGAVRGRMVSAIVVPSYQEPAVGSDAVRAVSRRLGIPITVASAGTGYRVGTARLRVLAPDRQLHGTRSDPNNNSLIVLATVAGRSVLLAGDAEVEEQTVTMAGAAAGPLPAGGRRAGPLRADVLKVAHHGSAYQDGGFLDAVGPTVALISVGRDNDFGQPSPRTVAGLDRRGATTLRSDLDGAVAVTTSGTGGRLAVVPHRTVLFGRSP